MNILNFIKQIKNKFIFNIITVQNWFFKKWGKNPFFLGAVHAYSIPALPPKVETYNNHVFVRIFRFIGGISFFAVFVSNLYLHLPTYIQLFLLITTCLHLTQVSIILIIKLCFSLYTLILKKKKFEVRNSPLNKYASLISQALYCMKFGCAVAGAGASFLAGGMAYDSLLESSGREKVFLPLMGYVYNSAFGHPPSRNSNTETQAKNAWTTATPEQQQQEIGKVTKVVKLYHSMNTEERFEFMNEINRSFEKKDKDKNKDKVIDIDID